MFPAFIIDSLRSLLLSRKNAAISEKHAFNNVITVFFTKLTCTFTETDFNFHGVKSEISTQQNEKKVS